MTKKCPNCGKVYTPVLLSIEPRNPDMLVQDQYPEAEEWKREQLISGLCSDECWADFLIE